MKCKYCDYEAEVEDELIHGLCLDCDRTRNQFAAAALMGLAMDVPKDYCLRAEQAFLYADAMMKARKGE